MTRLGFALAVSLAAATPALTDPLFGIWASPPDPKGQIGFMKIAPCGAAICGRLIRAQSASGQPVTTPNIGKRLLWGMTAQGGGAYGGGRVYVPLMKRDFGARLRLAGDKLDVKGCAKGFGCRSQTWLRAD